MSIELDVGSSCGVEFFDAFSEKAEEEAKSSHFHKSIFSPPFYPIHFSNSATNHPDHSLNTQKPNEFVLNRLGATCSDKLTVEASCQGGVEVSWGGKDGPEVNVNVSVEVRDDYGNWVEASAQQNSSGQGNARVDAGYDTDNNR